MLERLISAITDLPVILQGAMGSALFAFLLFVGQRLTVTLTRRLAQATAERKRRFLRDERFRLGLAAAHSERSMTFFVAAVLYRASRYVIRALVWLTLGLLFGATISVFGIIGYLGCLYYLLQALRVVRQTPQGDNVAAQLAEVKAELAQLDAKSE